MKVNMSKLGEALNLTQDQMESVADVHRTFCGEMLVASQANEEDRKALVEKAVLKELRYMNYLLNDKQYRTYVMLLKTTLNSRGLNKYREREFYNNQRPASRITAAAGLFLFTCQYVAGWLQLHNGIFRQPCRFNYIGNT